MTANGAGALFVTPKLKFYLNFELHSLNIIIKLNFDTVIK